MWRARAGASCRWTSSSVSRAVSSDGSLSDRVLAIRREDQSVWERRAPLSPVHVRSLIERHGCRVLVQPSNRRAYPSQSYVAAGAELREDLTEAHVILGVKQVPADTLLSDRTYCFFSHTIKAQPENMPLLDAVLHKNIRLVDYEKMIDSRGRRVVAFGKYAGVVGMIDIMHGLGLRLLALGHHTPFMHIGPAHNYRNSEMARQAVRDAGYEIALGLMPRSIGPLTFVFTGSGNVSRGAQEILQELPHEYVSPASLSRASTHGALNKVYCCAVSRHDHLERRDGGGYDAQEFEDHPERYISTFASRIAPHMSCLINGLYWAVNSPRVLTLPDAKRLLRPATQPWLHNTAGEPTLPHRWLALCDISADPGGSIEFMTECTTIDAPFSLYDAEMNRDAVSFRGAGVLVCSIDNMPTQLPREATDFFGSMLLPYMPDLMLSDATQPLKDHTFSPVVAGAVIASNGCLTKHFRYIDTLRQQASLSRHKSSSTSTLTTTSAVESQRRVLVLGSGYVAPPLVEYLTRPGHNINVLIASNTQAEMDTLRTEHNKNDSFNDQRRSLVDTTLTDVIQRPDQLAELVSNSDCVVSLLPYSLHPIVARVCIEHRVPLVTASYCTPSMRQLEAAAQDAGVLIVNEVGLDPGIDHLLAMQCFDEVHSGGGRVRSFVSYCGALPAPECSDNPLRYRFSWSPAGALRNSNAGARYIHGGQCVEIPAGQLLHSTHAVHFLPGFHLEAFANRDSTVYGSLYGIADEAHTLLRGTLRYAGYSRVVQALQRMNLLDETSMPALHSAAPDITWKQLICRLLDVPDQIFTDNLGVAVAQRVGDNQDCVAAIRQLGLMCDQSLVPRNTSTLLSLSAHLQRRLGYGRRERDVVVLRHNVDIEWPDRKRERRAITLVEYGQPDRVSALARTVGYPCAIAVRMVLDSEIQGGGGMVLPLSPEIYATLLRRLELENIVATHTSEFVE